MTTEQHGVNMNYDHIININFVEMYVYKQMLQT